MQGALGVVHIPKPGGTAALRALEGISDSYFDPIYFDPAMIAGVRAAKLPEARQTQFATQRFLRNICRDSRVVMGHYGAQALIEAGCAHIATQFREPRARVLSLYRYWQSVTDDERKGWGLWGDGAIATATLPLETFLDTSAAGPATDNAVARQRLVRVIPQQPRQARRLTRSGPTRPRLPADPRASGGRRMERRSSTLRRTSLCSGPGYKAGRGRAVNETSLVGDVQRIGHLCRELLEERTDLDLALLARLMSDGLIPPRCLEDLEGESRPMLVTLAVDAGRGDNVGVGGDR